jgi:hypothetical protein
MNAITMMTRNLPLALAALVPAAAMADDWEKFNDWNLGDVLYPNLHIHGVGGFTDGDAEELAEGAHDPRRDPFSAQAVEPGLSLRTKHIEGFTNYLFFQDADGDWDGELEEAFGKITNLPGGFELKGGQYLARFGALNDKHLHAWDFVDAETTNSRFLGEEGLLLQGAELSWTLPLGMDPALTAVASLGFGNARSHDHGHGHGDHEHDDESPHEGEESVLEDDVWTARLAARHRMDDFHSITAGISGAGGTNGFGRDTSVFGIDAEYLWRENGLEPGGRALRWRNELLWRDVEAFSEHDEDDDGVIDETYSGSHQEWGFHSHLIHTWNPRLDTGLRLGWVEGVDDFGQDGRFRVSPTVSWWFDDARRIALRAQYNYDAIESHEDAHSLWLQLRIALGSTVEVR